MNEETAQNANRKYKDTVFRMVFKEKKDLLSLFNAINGTNYDNSEELEVNTLENAVYMSMKNDVSCVLDLRMNLFEHQSTVNPNMPLRDLMYVAKLYEKMISKRDIYSKKRIQLPTPKFVVFYNGEEKQPERKVLRLSESFAKDTGEINLEVVVLQLNINPGYNKELIEKCKTLFEYIQFTERVRKYKKHMPFEEAIERAVVECIQEGILEEFLRENRSEVIAVSIFEYNEELHKKSLIEEGIERGIERGLSQGEEKERIRIIKKMLEDKYEPEIISGIVSKPVEYIYQIQEGMQPVVCEESTYNVGG